jgi:inhibitor of cysteine peptidase
MKQPIRQVLVLLLIAAVMLTACGAQPTDTPPVGETPSGGTLHGEAVVETIDVLILESFPVQVNVVAHGYLPDGCTEIDEIRTERTGQAFQIDITTARPADAMCTEAIVPFEETISLDVYGLPAGTYTVDVNGITGTFELAVDNALPTEPAPAGELQGGVLATFEVAGEQFRVWVTNPQAVQQILDLAAGNSLANIPNGRIVRGPGEGDHNLPWSWHLDAEEIEMAEVTIEVCDGTPSYVEEHVDEFVETVGRYCPWSARLVSVDVLLEEQSPSPRLVVDERDIVEAEVDGPGHVEYTERLGEQTLTRIEGLRVQAAEQRLVQANAALAPFGYRLEGRFDAEWNQTLYDLFREGKEKPIRTGLSYLWPVSVNASGTDFLLVVEKAPAADLYLVQADSIEPWDDAPESNWLPPGYVGDALARITYTDFPTLTYQVELGDQAVYSGTAVAMGAYMPLQSFTAWDNHWVLEVDDRLIMDGQDLGETMGYDAAFGFTLIRGEPFYFFEQEGKVRMSYGGQALPNVYDYVVHNQCCEASMHNPLVLGDAVLFHARWNGTWYFVEAGVYDGEMAGTYRYTAPEGWSFRYPMHWDRLDEELGFVQETSTGKTVTFASQPTTQTELERWIQAEIDRKLAATEAENTLAEPLTTAQEGELTVYRYAILSRGDGSETLLRATVFFDGQRRYEFYADLPPVAEEEYGAIVASCQPASR